MKYWRLFPLLVFAGLTSYYTCQSQPLNKKTSFTRQDTLRGSITPGRIWWNATKYDILVEPDYVTKTISGRNKLSFTAIENGSKMQIDLQTPMQLDSALYNGRLLPFSREENVFYLNFPSIVSKGTKGEIDLVFSGKPREAINPPWDGGWIWKKDSLGNPWMSVACQGLGASVWYPCKDHQSDEPDSATLTMIVPDTLVAVGNGRLLSKTSLPRKMVSYTWVVENPINNYNIIPYIGKYGNWKETYTGVNGALDCSFWVLEYNVERSKKHFREVFDMLDCFENWFGPYPFYKDSYKLVESPHLGMEHQSAVAYGNKYMKGYLGRDLSGTGHGLKWDYITIHESGHEWFANNITTKDIADMWVHEGFTTYSEVIYTEHVSGLQAANEYCIGLRKGIRNDKPLIGIYGVQQEGSSDMYAKGANIIHTIRQVIGDDEKFRSILRGLNKTFYHQTITTNDIENYISKNSGKDLSRIFDQYLRDTRIPVLEYKTSGNTIQYRWSNCIDGFNMPVNVEAGKKWQIRPTQEWQTIKAAKDIKPDQFKADPNYYITVKKAG